MRKRFSSSMEFDIWTEWPEVMKVIGYHMKSSEESVAWTFEGATVTFNHSVRYGVHVTYTSFLINFKEAVRLYVRQLFLKVGVYL